MKKFNASLKMEILLFSRSYYLWICIIAFTIYMYSGYKGFLQVSLNIGQLLQASSYIVMSSALIGMFSGLYISRREEQAGVSDVLLSINGDTTRPFAKMTAWGIICAIVTAILCAELIAITWFTGSEFIYFWKEIIIYIFLYWGFPLLLFGIFGYSLAQMISVNVILYPILFIFVLLFSPLNSFLSIIFPSEVLAWLNIGERKIDLVYSDFNGLNITLSTIFKRVVLLVVAIILLLISRMINRKRRVSKRERILLFSNFILALVLSISLYPFSKSALDKTDFVSYSDYYLFQDRDYYLQNKDKQYGQLNIEDSFIVEHYDINLTHKGNNISYNAKMAIRKDQDSLSDGLTFTLHHGMDVSAVTIKGQALKYKREGDWLYINWPKNMGEGELTVEVEGNNGAKGIITENSFFLSPTSAWYPIPGQFNIATMTDYNFEPQYRHVQMPYETDFQIKVNKSDHIFSNLPQIEKHVFSGKSRGPALVSGNLIEKNTDMYEFVIPPDRLKDFKANIDEMKANVEEIANLLQVEVPIFPKRIITMPSYSTMPNDAMIYTGKELYINEHFLKLETSIGLSNKYVAFHTFFWNNKYHNSNPENSTLIHYIIDYIERDHNSLLNTTIANLDRDRNNLTWLQKYLIKLNRALENDPQIAELLLRRAYQQWEEKDLSREDWFMLLNDISGRSTN